MADHRSWKGTPVFRSPVHVRDATPEDVDALVEVWGTERSTTRDPDPAEQEASASLARIAADPDQRLLVATIDETVAGAVHLMRAALSPITAETAVYVLHLQVRQEVRRHGVGRALMEATVTWGEEKGTSHVVAAASSASRDANRFMARLGLAQIAVVRGSTVAAMRAKLPVDPPAAARVAARNHRTVGQVLVQRRSMRRARTPSS